MYLSPEIVADTLLEEHPGFGAAADVWAVGVVFCMLLTGKEPFTENEVWSLPRPDGGSIRERLLSSSRFTQTSPEAKDLLGKLLAIDPGQRISAKQALQHPWFDTSASQSLAVTRESLIQVRMLSRASQKFLNEPSFVARSLTIDRMSSSSILVGSSQNCCYLGSPGKPKMAQNRVPRIDSVASLCSEDGLFCFDGS